MSGLRTALLLLATLALGADVAADPPPSAPPAAPSAPAPPANAPTPEQAAYAVRAAVAAQDAAALHGLAAKDEPDPWIVADELVRRGEIDAATAFAKAAPRADVEALPAYVEGRRARESDDAERKTLTAANEALKAGDFKRCSDLTADLASTTDTVTRVRLRHVRGTALWRLTRPRESAAAYEVAGDAALALGWLRRATDTYLWASQRWLEGSEFAQALARADVGLSLAERRGEAQRAGSFQVVRGRALTELGRLAEARAAYDQALARFEVLGERQDLVWVLTNSADLHEKQGEHAEQLAQLERALTLEEELGDKDGAERTFRNVCDVYYYRQDYDRALKGYMQTFDLVEARGDRANAAAVLTQVGNCQERLGDYARALSTQEDVLARFKALGDKAGVARAHVNIGNVYTSLGDPQTAFVHYKRGFDLAVELGLRQEASIAASNIGLTHLRRGDPAKARLAFEYALEGYRALHDRDGLAITLTNLGIAYKSLGQPGRALEIHREAAAMNEAQGNAAGLAMDHVCMGQAYRALGDPENARAAFERSAGIARSRRITRTLVLCLIELAELHLERREPALALATAREALGETEKLLGGLGEEQGATARAQWSRLFGVGALAAAREGDPGAVFTFLESGRAGALLADLDSREAYRWKDESLPPELARQDQEAQAAESAARAAYDQAARQGRRAELLAAGKALDEATRGVHEVAGRIQRALKQQASLFYPRARTIEETRSVLEADQALVLYGLCQDEALALVLRRDGERLVALGRVADVTAACEALDAKDATVDVEPALVALRRLLVEPLKLEGGVKQVIVSPEGPLCYLPFALLFEPSVAMTPSGTTHGLLLEEQVATGRGVLALGDPDYAGVSQGAAAIYYLGRPLQPLPATRAEVTAVGTQTLLGAEANEARLREALPTSPRWRAVHFACHGLVNAENPMLSSLALSRAGEADGFFTALEVLRTRIPADLVVLSACETATGKIVNGEGIVGLTRAFMFAGAPRVICSLWKVDDEATAALMRKFYELWNPKDGSQGLAAVEALRQAQAHVRSQAKWKHPYYWAAWVLWGLP